MSAASQKPGGNGAGAHARVDDAIEIARLAALSPLDYERERAAAAEALGITRLSTLDLLVKQAQGATNISNGQGEPINLPDPVPWPDPVDPKTLFDDIAAAIRAYVVIGEAGLVAVTLWVVAAHVFRLFWIFPRLFITAAEMQCGKSTLLDVVGMLVPRPLPTSDITPAALFRSIALVRPCLLLDEADSYLRPSRNNTEENESLRRLINAGHKANGRVIRVVGDNHEPRSFDVFCPLALAAIGMVSNTIVNRSIVVELHRRLANETVRALRLDRADDLTALGRQAARFAADQRGVLANATPDMPPELVNRGADNWRPLFAVASCGGASWVERVTAAALTLSGQRTESPSLGTLLLGDIKTFFDENPLMVEIASGFLTAHLAQLEDRPWPEFGRMHKPITPVQLASQLRSYHITPQQIWSGSAKHRGYKKTQFADVWGRYL